MRSMDGFTYNGVHCSELGVGFIPGPSDRWEPSPDFDVQDREVDSRDGGSYYSTRVKKRVFTLPCYYENITIATREKIRRWLDRKSSGNLMFDSRPFEFYVVHPTKVVYGQQYTDHNCANELLYSGTMTVVFTAYQPFGYMTVKQLNNGDISGVENYCQILTPHWMPPAPTTSSRNFLMYNCGTETCDTEIRIAGTASEGLTIANALNGTKCVIKSLPASGVLTINSFTGTVDVNGTLNYEYHDDGFLRLDPSPINLDISILTAAGSRNVTVTGGATPNPTWINAFVYINDWKRITGVDGNVISLENNETTTQSLETKLIAFNQIGVTSDGNINLTTFEIDYTPLLTY